MQNIPEYHCQMSHICTLALDLFTDEKTLRTLKIARWRHQNEAIRLMNEEIPKITEEAPEELINVILLLAVQNSAVGEIHHELSYRETPLREAYNFRAYMRTPTVPEQHKAWMFLAEQRYAQCTMRFSLLPQT